MDAERQSPEFRQTVAKAGFKCGRQAGDFCSMLKTRFGFQYNYDAARLCIGRSLAERKVPDVNLSDRDLTAPIRGENLFGDEIDLWICLLLEADNASGEPSVNLFRHLVEAHWERGAQLLKEDWEQAKHDDIKFLMRLSDLLPEGRVAKEGFPLHIVLPRGAVTVPLGPVSTFHATGEPAGVTINGPGDAPHIALMGRNGTGKTRSGIFIAARLHQATEAPVLIIDPKGDYIEKGRVRPHVTQAFPGIRGVDPGETPVPLDFLPGPEAGAVAITQAAMRFRDSLNRCFRVAGDVQQNDLRTAVETVMSAGSLHDLDSIRHTYQTLLRTRSAKDVDTVTSKLTELTSLQLFAPTMSAAAFFGSSWVIGLHRLQSDEVKRLVILLILDALANYVLSQDDSPAAGGFRSLRHILYIDEARRVLSEKKYQSLVDLLRQGRSKGEVVILISQDPSDFDGQADDFTTQLGTVVAFTCAALRGLRALQGAYGRKLQPAEFSDSELPAGVALAKLPGRLPEKVVCWRP